MNPMEWDTGFNPAKPINETNFNIKSLYNSFKKFFTQRDVFQSSEKNIKQMNRKSAEKIASTCSIPSGSTDLTVSVLPASNDVHTKQNVLNVHTKQNFPQLSKKYSAPKNNTIFDDTNVSLETVPDGRQCRRQTCPKLFRSWAKSMRVLLFLLLLFNFLSDRPNKIEAVRRSSKGPKWW